MAAIRVRRHLNSDTLRIPELRELIGRDVEIVVNEVEEPKDTESSKHQEVLDDKYPLRGSLLWYDDPCEPVGVEDWEALQ